MKNYFFYQGNLLTIIFLFASCVSLQAQIKVGDNPTIINPNSLLEMESTNRGLLLPRVSLSSTGNSSPLLQHVDGMIIYNTATTGDVIPGFYVNDGVQWKHIADFSSVWKLTGNDLTGTEFLGSTNNQPVKFFTDNSEKVRITEQGYVGIGSLTPQSLLEIKGASSFISVINPGTSPAAAGLRFRHDTYLATHTSNLELQSDGVFGLTAQRTNGTIDMIKYFPATNYLCLGLRSGSVANPNIGINQANPTHTLHVTSSTNPLRLEGLQTATDSDVLTADANGVVHKRAASSLASSEPWYVAGTTNQATSNSQNIYQSGKVGIGNSIVSNALTVGQDIGVTGSGTWLSVGSQFDYPAIAIGRDNNNYGYLLWHNDYSILRLSTKSAGTWYDHVFLKRNKLGVGNGASGTNVDPKSSLSVRGEVGIGLNYAYGNQAPTSGLIVEGNVGIGNPNPSNKLDVSGNVAVTGTLTAAYINVSQIVNLTPLSVAPAGVQGRMYFDSTTNKLRVYDGTTWQDCW